MTVTLIFSGEKLVTNLLFRRKLNKESFMANENLNQGNKQFNQDQQKQQGGINKSGVGQQPAQGQNMGKQQGTTQQPINNPNVRK